MKLLAIIGRSLKEQVRSYWLLLLAISMGPFFIFVYYLIIESSQPEYEIMILNNDSGIIVNGKNTNYGNDLAEIYKKQTSVQAGVPFKVIAASEPEEAIKKLRDRDADLLVTIDTHFSRTLENTLTGDGKVTSKVEFTGDLTRTEYLISAVWANEIVNEFALKISGGKRIVQVSETALGISASVRDFDVVVPGILIVSIIMLMFTASIAFVSEVENRTIMRLKMSKVTTLEYLAGISTVQVLVGIISALLTLVTAICLGFQYAGSLLIMILIASLTSISIIAFSLIIAALTRSATEVLVVGNFPMFLFMFFTGAAFPLKSNALFTVSDYPVTIQGLMSPVHAISALNKTLVMNMDLSSILPEIISMLILSIIYFTIGGIIFKRRHLKLT